MYNDNNDCDNENDNDENDDSKTRAFFLSCSFQCSLMFFLILFLLSSSSVLHFLYLLFRCLPSLFHSSPLLFFLSQQFSCSTFLLSSLISLSLLFFFSPVLSLFPLFSTVVLYLLSRCSLLISFSPPAFLSLSSRYSPFLFSLSPPVVIYSLSSRAVLSCSLSPLPLFSLFPPKRLMTQY